MLWLQTHTALQTTFFYASFTLHAEPNRTERVPWLMFVFTHQPTTDSVAQ